MIYYSQQLFSCRFGPLIRHWTMRYEAKHAYFKSLSQSMGNFINVPYSLALRHQLHQCYLKSSELEVDNNITIGPGDSIASKVHAHRYPCIERLLYFTKLNYSLGNVIVPEEVEEVSMNIVTAFW